MIHKLYLNRKGFTLLETLTSIGILAFVIIGPLASIINSSSYARKTKDTMTATYLAEDAVELLQNQYDSLFVYCRKQPDASLCTPSVAVPNENSSQVAWRLFKDRFAATSTQPSCYTTDNPDGCAFDTLNMIGDVTAVPTRYVASAATCPALSEVTVEIPPTINGTNPGGVTQLLTGSSATTTRHTFMCIGASNHIPVGATVSAKSFKRTMKIEHLTASFETGLPLNQQYHDDLRVAVNVEFKSLNGATSSVLITRFMHARQ